MSKEAWPLAAALGALAGCTEPAVEVRFAIPPAYRAATAAVRLQILEPPATEPFSCDDVAFGAVSDEAVRLRTALEVTLDGADGDAPLSGVRREGDKLFVAEALDVGGLRVAAACALQGTIEEDVTLELEGEAASVGTLAAMPIANGTPELSQNTTVPLVLTDALGAPLADAALRWLVVGPKNEQTYASGTRSAGDGTAVAEVAPTSLAGPALVELRPRWTRERIPVLRFLQPSNEGVKEALPNPPSDVAQTEDSQAETPAAFVLGKIGPNGEPGFVALGPLDTSGRKLRYRYFAGRQLMGPTDRSFTADPNTLPTAVALRGSNGWVALSKTRWYDPSGEGALTLANTPLAAAGIGSCDGASAEVVVELGNDQFVVLDQSYAPIAAHPLAAFTKVDLAGSGCVSDAAGALHRMVAFAATQEQPAVCSQPGSLVLWSDLGTLCVAASIPSVGFAPALDSSALLMLPNIDEAGFRVEGYRLGANAELELETSVPTLLPALSPRAGDLDGDGKLDLIAALITELESASELSYSILLSLGVEHRGERLVAFGPRAGGRLPGLHLDDLDGDGFADLLLTTRIDYTVVWMGPR